MEFSICGLTPPPTYGKSSVIFLLSKNDFWLILRLFNFFPLKVPKYLENFHDLVQREGGSRRGGGKVFLKMKNRVVLRGFEEDRDDVNPLIFTWLNSRLTFSYFNFLNGTKLWSYCGKSIVPWFSFDLSLIVCLLLLHRNNALFLWQLIKCTSVVIIVIIIVIKLSTES